MTYIPKLYATSRNGKAVFDSPQQYQIWMEKFKDGTELEVVIKRKYKKRSSGQFGEGADINGYYWGVIVAMVADQIGEADRQAVHDWIQMSIGNVKRMPGGREVAGSTAEMSGGEFAEMCAKARTWAGTAFDIFGEGGLYLPSPHEGEWTY
jgi:hypothetical protein